jgi:hypothetical protein
LLFSQKSTNFPNNSIDLANNQAKTQKFYKTCVLFSDYKKVQVFIVGAVVNRPLEGLPESNQ